MKIEVIEICSTANSTVSMLYVDGVHLHFIVEDGYREKKVPGETRIDGGMYYLQPRFHGKFFEDYKRRFGHEFAIEIAGVKNFSDILCHIGNTRKDTRGCQLNNTGFKRDKASGDYIGIDSTTAYLEFYNLVAPVMKTGLRIPYNVIRKIP